MIALRRCVALEGESGALVSVRLPDLALRLLAHLSNDDAMLRAIRTADASGGGLLGHLTHEASAGLPATGPGMPSMAIVWRRMLDGRAGLPASVEELFLQQSDMLALPITNGTDDGDRPGDAAALRLLETFSQLRDYHIKLIRDASARTALTTLAGRGLPVSPLLRSDRQREQAAVAAALLGDMVSACADDVSGLLVGRLARGGGEAIGQWHLLVHGRCELLFSLREGEVADASALRAAVQAAADEVEQLLKLKTILRVEVEEVRAWPWASM